MPLLLLDAVDVSIRAAEPLTVTVSLTPPTCIIASWITDVPSIETLFRFSCLKPPSVSSIRYEPAGSPPNA